MKYRDVVSQSIKAFKEGRQPEELSKTKSEGLTYTPEYFDKMEKDVLGDESEEKEEKDNGDS